MDKSDYYALTYPHQQRNVGSLQITVSGSVAYHHPTSPSAFTVAIEIDTVRDFPIDLSTEKSHVSLKLPTSKQTFFLKPESPFKEKSGLFYVNGGFIHKNYGPVVKLNYTGVFQQYMLAIRIEILENVICPSVKSLFPPLDAVKDLHPRHAAHTYTLNNSISDVYLARDYLSRDSVIKLLSHTGYYQASCRALVKGQTCSQTLSNNVIRIHHLPSIMVIGAQKIEISTKRTDDCSFQCSLNVAIWEIVVINKTQLLRYHEWRGIYHLTWEVIAQSARGFPLHINTTCNKFPCSTKLCDVAVSFSTMLKWEKLGWLHRRTKAHQSKQSQILMV